MDPSFPVSTDDGDLQWSDDHSMYSDDGHSIMMPNSPAWMDALPTGSSSHSASSALDLSHTGQLSPVSTGMDIPGAAAADTTSTCVSNPSSVPTMIHSASSTSSNDSWPLGGGEDSDDMEAFGDGDSANDALWERGSDDALVVPKLEPMDDDLCLDGLHEAPGTPMPDDNILAPAEPQKVKRPRGRPRKHPLTPIVTASKVTKGRSKTGCLTCRKRKKKCDEAKPRCMNCEKNAVVCEGYPEKQFWKSGKEKAEERMKTESTLPSVTLQPMFLGLESLEDRILWKHYNEHLSAVLTVEGEFKNAFKDMIVPIAVKHRGVMHSILALAGQHIDFDTPYGAKLLEKNPTVTDRMLQRRAYHHHVQAMRKLFDDIERNISKDDPEFMDVLTAQYAQMVCLLLESIAAGDSDSSHRIHLLGYQRLASVALPQDEAFATFIVEFFQYHIFADELIYFPHGSDERLASEEWTPSLPILPARLLGVADGLLHFLAKITSIRNTVRERFARRIDPVIDYEVLYDAAELDGAIREWTPDWPERDSRNRVSMLYQKSLWIYLNLSIHPPSLSSASSSMASSATSLPLYQSISSVTQNQSSIANTPPHSASTSCASSPRLGTTSALMDIPTHEIDPRAHPPSRKNSTMSNASTASEVSTASFASSSTSSYGPPTKPAPSQPSSSTHRRPDSPPPIRRPPNQDVRMPTEIDEGLGILESFKPSDPSQRLLLLPCLLLGSGCFAPAQRQRARSAIRTVRGYTGLRNTDRVLELLEEVWRRMDAGDWLAVWDWQGVAKSLKLDFLCG